MNAVLTNKKINNRITYHGYNTSAVIHKDKYSGITATLPDYNFDKVITVRSDGMAVSDQKLTANKKTLGDIAALKENWNENGAEPFNKSFIVSLELFIEKLAMQPDIYPTANHSVQFEYYDKDDNYLEFEIFENGTVSIYCEKDGQEQTYTADFESKMFNRVIGVFYGQ